MKYVLFCLLLILGNTTLCEAQDIDLNEDALISRMMDRRVQINRSNPRVSGWRIQLLATTDRSKVEKEKRSFMRKYPATFIDWTHSKPYYKLRVGAFQSKLEASRLLYQIRRDYPSAYPAKDNIELRELVGL
ncbi:MAG: SPOR domain-containing protein [Saprospiraceae bacterium]